MKKLITILLLLASVLVQAKTTETLSPTQRNAPCFIRTSPTEVFNAHSITSVYYAPHNSYIVISLSSRTPVTVEVRTKHEAEKYIADLVKVISDTCK